MYVSTITISSKGQIVLPKKARKILGSNTISVFINDQNQVLLNPVNELGGVLSTYNKPTDSSFDEMREQPWESITLPNDNDLKTGAE